MVTKPGMEHEDSEADIEQNETRRRTRGQKRQAGVPARNAVSSGLKLAVAAAGRRGRGRRAGRGGRAGARAPGRRGARAPLPTARRRARALRARVCRVVLLLDGGLERAVRRAKWSGAERAIDRSRGRRRELMLFTLRSHRARLRTETRGQVDWKRELATCS